MYNYIVVEDTVWVDENFNTETHPTIVEVKELSGAVAADNHHAFKGGEMGKIFIDGVMYNDPSAISEEEE